MTIIEYEQSDDDLPPVTIDILVAAGVDSLCHFGTSGGLMLTPRVKNDRWCSAARAVQVLEQVVGLRLQGARDRLDAVRNDPWCQVTADWGDL